MMEINTIKDFVVVILKKAKLASFPETNPMDGW